MTKQTLPTPEELQQHWHFPSTYGKLSQAQQLVAAGDRILGVTGGAIFSIDIFHAKQPQPDAKGMKPGFPFYLTDKDGVDPCVTAAGGNVYFMHGKKLMALRLSDGLPLQTRDEKDQLVPWKPPEIENVNSLLAVEGKLIALHLSDSGEAFVTGYRAVNGTKAFGPIAISNLTPGGLTYGDGAVFFVVEDLLHAVNVDFGDKRFERTEGGRASEDLLSSVTPCVAGEVVVAAGSALHFFNVKTGAEIFEPIKPSSRDAAWSTPVAADKGKLIVASNTVEVMAIRSTDGKVVWRTKLDGPGQPSLLRKRVVVTTNGGTMLLTLHLASGIPDRLFKLPQSAALIPPIVNNETVFIPEALGSIEARAFGKQHAAYFDGHTSRIDIKADQDSFDFGVDDFTVEAWVRSSEGGEIISSYPTLNDPNAHGFRLNIGPNGELRVAVVNAQSKSVHAGRSRETVANDGEWHHVALIRRSGDLLALLDGKSLDLYFRDDSAKGLRIGGHSALTVGAYIPGAGKDATDHFEGLIRELRIWDRALDVATVQNNRHVQLTGTEPRLKGLWSLTEAHGKEGSKLNPVNAVPRRNVQVQATFITPASSPTDLALDRAAFPYLLHESDTHWPYAGTWAARGERAVSTPAALADNALAFATNNAIYAVRRADGRRLWDVDVAKGTSAPVADGSRFLALTGDEGLIAIDARSGEYKRLDTYAGLVKSSDTALPAPAVSARYIAVAGQSGTVKIADRASDPVKMLDVTLPSPIRNLALGATRLFVCCGSDQTLKIAIVDPAGNRKSFVDVNATAFTTDDDWLFCVRHGVIRRVDANNAEMSAQEAVGDKVTGLAAHGDSDLLVVTTGDGWVYSFAMSNLAKRWQVRLTEMQVNAPVFDVAGRVYCTTTGGTIAVLDGSTGTRMGLYKTPQPITTAPLVESATAYFGCADPTSAEAYCDGALHSVVVGETMVLRLGLDEYGAPSSRAKPYALVDIQTVDIEKHTLHLMDATRSCVETWINIPPSRVNSARRPGGGVFGLCPTEGGGFDINVSVDENGTLRYSSRSRQGTGWRILRAEAATQLNDGQWHHLALSRDCADHVAIYIDGKLLEDVTIEEAAITAPKTVTGIKTFIGATAGDDLGAVQPFAGMIAEVRVWDTYMEPQEIAARMHVKLRGSEPDLLAYWNFDRQNIEDAGPDHHHGKLVDTSGQPLWWLTDLAFEKPSYPFITTSGTVLPALPNQPPTYEITFAVHRADGSGLPDHLLDLWYVRHRQNEPDDILIDGTRFEGVMAAVPRDPYSVKTGRDGRVSVVIAPKPNHVPSIDVRAGFMPGNERFHVNVLLGQQTHFVPVPPMLVAQSRLIQDYAYSRGGTIDEKRDRSTWRTVIKALNPDGSPRANEPVSLWATEQLDVEVAGHRYSLNKENSAELATDGEGEVVIVFDADDLNATALMARAGFMHRNDRVTVAPDQDLHRQLTTVKGSDLTHKRPTQWKRGMKEGDGEPLFDDKLAPHADKVADAINKVMASAKPADANPAPAPRGKLQLLRGQARAKSGRLRNEPVNDPLAPMRQPALETAVDSVVMLRSRTHEPRVAAINPDGMRFALAGCEGFVFDTSANGLRFKMLETRAEVDVERGEPTPEPIVLRGFFDDLWDVIVDTATDIYDGAVKVVVSIAEKVEVAIHKMVEGIKQIVHVVVDSIVDAANAVANFFEQIGVAIMKAIEFLRTLFNWKAILATKDIIQQIFVDSVGHVKVAMSKEKLQRALLPLVGVPDMKPKSGPSLSAQAGSANEAQSAALDEARGVQGQMMMQKSREGISSVTPSSTAPRQMAEDRDVFTELIKGIPLLVPQLTQLSPADVMEKLLALAKDGFDASIRLFIDEIVAISGAAFELLDWGMKLLRARIYIPFITELYEFITDSPLTMLDVVCLAMAVPVHVAHIAITTLRGNTRTFAQDNAGLVAQLRASASGKPLRLAAGESDDDKSGPPQPRPNPMNTDSETLLIVLRGINIAAGLASDTLFARMISAGGFGAATQGMARMRGLAKVVKGGTGIAASYVQTYKSVPAFEERLRSGLHKKDWENIKPPSWIADATFGVLVAGDSITFAGGLKQTLCPPAPTAMVDGVIPADWLDSKEYSVATKAGFGCIGLIGARIYFLQDQMGKLAAVGADDKMVKQALFFGLRDLFTIFSRMPWFMFTQAGANKILKTFPGGAEGIYGGVTAARALCQALALGTHVISVEVYGK